MLVTVAVVGLIVGVGCAASLLTAGYLLGSLAAWIADKLGWL